MLLGSISSDIFGFSKLVELYASICGPSSTILEIDMARTSWFDANLCAVLGAIIHISTRKNGNIVKLVGIQPQVRDILARNGFLQQHDDCNDYFNTTVAYRRFDFSPSLNTKAVLQSPVIEAFREYARAEFLRNPEISSLPAHFLDDFSWSIFEMFDNAVIHSETEDGIFSCGQYFHQQDKLCFTVVDLGIGIGGAINKHLGINIAPEQAISRVVKGGITTKINSHNIMGGSGLSLLREFAMSNKGGVYIMSGNGYWQLTNGEEEAKQLNHTFHGTVISLTINIQQTPTNVQ